MTGCLVCGGPATSGLLLDAKCLDQLGQDVATCARLHRSLEQVLVRSGGIDGEHRAARADAVGIALDDAAVLARDHIRATLVGWVRVAQEERPGPEWPQDRPDDLARWILRNLTWYAGRDWCDEMARTFAETADDAVAAMSPERPRRVPIGPCPERLEDDEGQDDGPCEGDLYAIIHPADSLLPVAIRCTGSREHAWTADRWHALGRRVARRAAEVASVGTPPGNVAEGPRHGAGRAIA